MTDDSNPVSQAFALQRKTIEQSQEAMRQGLEYQQRLNEAVLDSVEGGSHTTERGTEMTRDALHSTLDAIEQIVPDASGNLDQIRESIDEQFDAAQEATEQATDQAIETTESGIDNIEEVTEAYLDSVDEQIETLLATHEDLEDQALDFVEETERQLEQLQNQASGDVVSDQIRELQGRTQDLRDQLDN